MFVCAHTPQVSGQLHAEAFATSLSRVYTFGPTFRAEVRPRTAVASLRVWHQPWPALSPCARQNSNTSRHLCEFWMIEPEMAFANLEDVVRVTAFLPPRFVCLHSICR